MSLQSPKSPKSPGHSPTLPTNSVVSVSVSTCKNKTNTRKKQILTIYTSINGIKLQEMFPAYGGTDTPIGDVQ